MQTPFSKAWVAWLTSGEGKRCTEGRDVYNQNRLHAAFSAGWVAHQLAPSDAWVTDDERTANQPPSEDV